MDRPVLAIVLVLAATAQQPPSITPKSMQAVAPALAAYTDDVLFGDVVWTAPGARHWHGATRTSAMTHVGVTQASHGRTVTCMEPLGEAQYHGPQ